MSTRVVGGLLLRGDMAPVSPIRVAHLYLIASAGFDPAEFRALKTESLATLRERYLLSHGCKLLGQGADRNVYDLGERVLKLMRMSANSSANLKEIETSRCLGNSNVIARVLDHAVDGSWLIAEKAKPFTSEAQWLAALNKVLKLPGHLKITNAEDFIVLVDTYKTPRFKKNPMVAWVEMNPTPWWVELYRAVNEGSCSLDVFDYKPENWGMIGNRMVMVDYGGNAV